MSTVLAQAQIILTADTARFTQEITNARNLSVNSFDDIKKSAQEIAKISLMGVVAGATAGATALAAMTAEQVRLGTELAKTAQVANTSVAAIQKYTFAAKAAGIEQDKLGDILKDVQDKIGDYLNTGGGELTDFMKNVGTQAGLTAEKIRHMSGPDALQAMWDAIEKANVSFPEAINYMESMGDEASLLIPYLRNGGEGFKLWGDAAEKAGAKMDEKTLRATQELKTSTDLLDLSYRGVKNQISAAFMPVLSDLATDLVKDATLKHEARKAGDMLAVGFKFMAKTGLGAVATFDMMGTALGGLLAMVGQLGNGVDWNSPYAFFQVGKNFWENNKAAAQIGVNVLDDLSKKLDSYANKMEYIDKLGTGGRGGMVSYFTDLRIESEKLSQTYGKTGAQIQEQLEKEKELAKEREKIAKEQASGKYAPIPVNSTVLAHASRYGYSELEKRYGLPAGLLSAISMQESRGNPNATSYVGAKGEFQFMPATARRFGIAGQERNTAVASEAAAKYLSQHLRMFGDLDKAIAAYNAGEGNVQKYGGIPPFKETKGYVKGVRGYLSFMNGGKAISSGYDVAGALANDAQEAERARTEAERQAKEQYDLQMKYVTEFADEKTKLYLEHTARETEIGKINDISLREQLLKTETTRYQNKVSLLELEKDKQIQKATEWQQTDAERIRANAELERREVGLTLNISKELRTAQIDAITAKEQQALRDISDAYQTELDNMTAYNRSESQRLRDDYQNNLRGIDSNSKYSETQKSDLRNALAGKFNSDLSIIRKPAADAFNSLNAEMSGTTELMNLQNQLNQRLDIIKKAKDAEVIATEQAERAKAQIERQYQISRYDMMMSSGQQILGSVTSSLKATLGEHNKAYRVMFAIEKGVNIARSLMAINTGIAMAAANPFPMNLGAMVSVAAATASIVSDLMAIKNPVGQAHDGIMSVPESGTWNLQKGERVLPEYTAKRLDRTLDDVSKKGNGGGNVNIVFENHTSATISQAPSKDGEMRFIIRDEIDSYVPQQLSRTNTPISQALLQNTTATRRV